MKTEDIDKRIGMPNVDAEWARFEQEVIGKEPKTSKRSFYSWIGSFAIAASVVIVAGLFFLKHDSRGTEQILTEKNKNSISQEVGSEPSSSEKPTELIAQTSQPKKTKENRKGSTVNDFIYVSTATDNTFDCGEESAVFPGGEEALKAFIKANLKLPNLVIEYGAKGRIFMSFVIDSVGEVSDIRLRERPQARISYDTSRLSKEPEDTQEKIKELITLQLGEEGRRVLSLMPRWRPAIWGGKPRKTIYFFPIIFDASKAERQEFLAKNLAFESVDQTLQGQIAGLDVVPNSSNLGKGTTMRLRGTTTIDNSKQPLVVLNGKILEIPDSVKIGNYDTEEQFASLLGVKPEDIKSIVVIKDSKATAKWGEKGAAGVIEISTKQYLAHKDVNLTGAIAGLDLPPQVINLGSGYVMRNLGYKYRIPDGEPLLLINGALFPDSVKKSLNNMEIGHLDKFFYKFFKQRHQILKDIKVLKDEEERLPYMEKFGNWAQYGVINITTSPDTLCDYYMAQHEELKANRYRISGIVLDEDNKPLPHTMIAVVKEGNKIWGSEVADSTGHFAFWAPRTGVTIHFSYVGFYKVVERKPTDKPLTIRMKPTKDLKKLKNLSFE